MYLHTVYTMIAKVKKWGNSLAIRLTRNELEEYGLKEGDEVKIMIKKMKPEGKVDLTDLPTFKDDDKSVSLEHDKYLYGSD